MFILLADSNKFYVAVLQTMLSQAGFSRMGSAGNGVECLIKINKKEIPDVIIIDESLCYVEGMDIIEKIRDSRPEIRIIILTCVDSAFDTNLLPEKGHIFLMEKSRVNAENLPQVLYNIFTEKLSSTKLPASNKVFTSLRRSFTGMLNFAIF